MVNISFNLQKLFIQGKIDKLYSRMYSLAEDLAVHEVKLYQSLTSAKMMRDFKKNDKRDFTEELLDKVVRYRQKRIEFYTSI